VIGERKVKTELKHLRHNRHALDISKKDAVLSVDRGPPTAMKTNYFENEYAEFWNENDVLFFIYKPGITMNLQAAKLVVADRISVQKNIPYPVFCDMRGIKDSDKPARDYLAKEGSTLVKAVAVLIESPVTKIMANFYLTISRPTVPTKMFTDKIQALDFLQTFKLQEART
jgi:hypothetical protein